MYEFNVWDSSLFQAVRSNMWHINLVVLIDKHVYETDTNGCFETDWFATDNKPDLNFLL
jgi:hypothetical protein